MYEAVVDQSCDLLLNQFLVSFLMFVIFFFSVNNRR